MVGCSIIFTVFCGRRRYLSILMKYVTRMLDRGIIHECHLWDFTKSFQDYKYLMALGSLPDPRVKVMHVNRKLSFGEYYQHYARSFRDEPVVVVKCDDDVVYIDVAAMNAFLSFRISHPDHLLCFPQIVNNGLCAYYMQLPLHPGIQIPKIPHTFEKNNGGFETLVEDGTKAAWLHAWFLDAKETDTIKKTTDSRNFISLEPDQRISINMFAILAKDLHLLADPNVTTDDETYLTTVMPSMVGRANSVFWGTTVSHFGYSPQRLTGLGGNTETQLLERYDALASHEQMCEVVTV